MKATYQIPATNLGQFESQVADLNKRCRRLGIQEISWSTEHSHLLHRIDTREGIFWVEERKIASYLGRYHGSRRNGAVLEILNLTVEGEEPKLEGWKFIATLAPIAVDEGESANVVRCVPGEKCPVEYRERVGECDHCNTRRQRNETFVLRHEDGTCKMVGRQCLKDFLGHANPHALASAAEILASLGELCGTLGDPDYYSCGQEVSSWTLEHFLAQTCAVIRNCGWVSGSAAYNDESGRLVATKSTVLYLLRPAPSSGRVEHQQLSEKCRVENCDLDRAAAALAWVESLEGDLNDYLYCLAVIARAGFVSPSNAGYAASMIVAHAKHLDREIERQRRTARLDEFFGEEGKRYTLALRVEKIVECQGYSYGPWDEPSVSFLHVMTDAEGHPFTCFASYKHGEQGDVIVAKATVKAHDVYREKKQTKLTRMDSDDVMAPVCDKLNGYYDKLAAKGKLPKVSARKFDELKAEIAGIGASVVRIQRQNSVR